MYVDSGPNQNMAIINEISKIFVAFYVRKSNRKTKLKNCLQIMWLYINFKIIIKFIAKNTFNLSNIKRDNKIWFFFSVQRKIKKRTELSRKRLSWQYCLLIVEIFVIVAYVLCVSVCVYIVIHIYSDYLLS